MATLMVGRLAPILAVHHLHRTNRASRTAVLLVVMLPRAEPTIPLANSSMDNSNNPEDTARHRVNMVLRLNMGNRNNSTEGPARHRVNMVLRLNMASSLRSNMVSRNSSREARTQDRVNTAHKPNMANSNSSKRTDSKETSTAHPVHTAAELQQTNSRLHHQVKPRANTNRKRTVNRATNTAHLARMAVEHHQTSSHLLQGKRQVSNTRLHQDKRQASSTVSRAPMEVRRSMDSHPTDRMMLLNRGTRVGIMDSSNSSSSSSSLSTRPIRRRIRVSRVVLMRMERRIMVKRLRILGGDDSVAWDACSMVRNTWGFELMERFYGKSRGLHSDCF